MTSTLLQGQTALVTGGTSGIGKAIALELAKAGAKVAIFGTNHETGQAAAAELCQASPGAQVVFFPADVSQCEAVIAAIKEVTATLGQVDILVNNAGITADQLLLNMSEAEWDKVLDTNLKSCFSTSKQVLRTMMKARRGKIINISSVVGLTGNAGQSNYAASKAGMIGFTKALAKEMAPRSITVNCIAPGFISTKMTDKLTDAQKEALIKQIPLGRLGLPEEIAHAVLFLASPQASYITGQVLTVDGGMVM